MLACDENREVGSTDLNLNSISDLYQPYDFGQITSLNLGFLIYKNGMSVLQYNALKLRKCWYLVLLVTVNKEEWKIHK